MEKIKVLVVDDSALMRKIISDMINEKGDMEVVAVARNGEELLQKIEIFKPDVVTLDVEMPKINGVQALQELKRRKIKMPVIMLSSITTEGARITIECLELGAFDFISKPSGSISLDINKVKNELIEKIKCAYNNRNKSESISKSIVRKKLENPIEAIVIGASTGGPKALTTIVTNLPPNLGLPILIVQHMPIGFTKAFAERLNHNSKIEVVEAMDGMKIEKDVVYIAQGGSHMEISSDKKIKFTKEPAIWGVRPAVDKLFISAAKVYKNKLMSIILTGMGKDGAEGSIEVKKHGGFTISQDENTCTIYGMPKAAYETGIIDEVLPLGQVLSKIIKSSMN